MSKRRLILAIDFDGTICEHKFPDIGNVLPRAFEVLKSFIEKGDRLILWTCREGRFKDEAIEFCRLNGVEFESHNENLPEHNYDKSRKIYADIYVDDRMIGGFPGWDVIERYVNEIREFICSIEFNIVK